MSDAHRDAAKNEAHCKQRREDAKQHLSDAVAGPLTDAMNALNDAGLFQHRQKVINIRHVLMEMDGEL